MQQLRLERGSGFSIYSSYVCNIILSNENAKERLGKIEVNSIV